MPVGVKGFQKGHAKIPGSGTKLGQSTAPTRILKDAAILAAEAVGQNGKGLDGLVGYLKFVAVEHPPAFMTLLSRILPEQIRMELTQSNQARTTVVLTTREEVVKELRDRGIPHQAIPFLHQADVNPEITDAETVDVEVSGDDLQKKRNA